MGVKWTYTLLCLLGTANLLVEANPAPESVARMRESPEFKSVQSAPQVSLRDRRDVNTIIDDNGNQVSSAKSSSDEGRSFSYSGTAGSGTSVSSSSSNGGSAFGFATSRIGGGGGGPPSNTFESPSSNSGNFWPGSGSGSFGGSSSNVGNSWPGSGSNLFGGPSNNPGNSWAGSGAAPGFNQNYRPNVGSNPYYANQYSGPFGGGYGLSSEDFVQQYFRAIEAQNQAVQAQFIQPQPGARSGSYSSAHAGAYMTGPNGRIDPNARSYSYASTSMPRRSVGVLNTDTSQVNPRQRYEAAHLGYGNRNRFNSFGFNNGGTLGNGFDGIGAFNPGVTRGGFVQPGIGFPAGGNSAVASTSFGPNGGFQYGEISPAAPGVVSRFAETHPSPSSGNSYQTYSSSSSVSELNPDGTVTNKKTASSVINDNGKVTGYTVKDR